ncbi:MAG: alkyl hydroperoxide reductase subunit F [Bacteroides sp.]|nr:alkyl hydroperoxide reductase subunit F [Bacteroides sp.]
MLDQDIITQLKGIFANLQGQYEFVVNGLKDRTETKNMEEFVRDFASSSQALEVRVVDTPTEENAPVLELWKDGNPTGVSFCGIPNGHEFTSLILAVLNAAGQGKNLPDDALRRRIEHLQGPVKLQTFVSLTCTNCPDVVQALNIVALINPAFSNTTIDGAVTPEMVKAYNIQSVPTVYANGELLHVGRSDLGELVGKLEQKFGSAAEPGAVDGTARGFDAIVVGGGPAGAGAAIYLARKGLQTAVIAGRIGGQVKDTTDIENLISVPLTTGTALAADLRRHLEQYDITILDNRKVKECNLDGFPKSIITDGNETFEAPIVVVATGASWRRLGIPGEEEYIGRGVAFCTHCDAPFYAGKRVAVVGGGNSGIEAAIDLAGIASHVDVFEFLDGLKADEVLQKKLATFDNVEVHLSSAVSEVEGNGSKVTGIKVTDRKTDKVDHYDVDGVFVQIGLSANSAPFSGQLKTNRVGEIITDRLGRTEITGVYAAGDVTDIAYKQIVIAMGEGAKAALSAVDDRMRGVTPS